MSGTVICTDCGARWPETQADLHTTKDCFATLRSDRDEHQRELLAEMERCRALEARANAASRLLTAFIEELAMACRANPDMPAIKLLNIMERSVALARRPKLSVVAKEET